MNAGILISIYLVKQIANYKNQLILILIC